MSYAIIEAYGSNQVEGEASRLRTWGEPRCVFTADSFEECYDWWKSQRESENMRRESSPYDYVMLLTPDGPRNLLNQPMHDGDNGWVQCRLGHFGRPDSLT